MNKYSDLLVASLHPSFLETDARKHTFVFGAIAEFVDNAVDANAKSLTILSRNYQKENVEEFMLIIQDDGDGISPDDAKEIFLYGYTSKQRSSNKIGLYGDGLKAGSMRLAKDMIIFTRNGSVNTIILLSRQFYEQEELQQIIIPMPSFEDGLNVLLVIL